MTVFLHWIVTWAAIMGRSASQVKKIKINTEDFLSPDGSMHALDLSTLSFTCPSLTDVIFIDRVPCDHVSDWLQLVPVHCHGKTAERCTAKLKLLGSKPEKWNWCYVEEEIIDIDYRCVSQESQINVCSHVERSYGSGEAAYIFYHRGYPKQKPCVCHTSNSTVMTVYAFIAPEKSVLILQETIVLRQIFDTWRRTSGLASEFYLSGPAPPSIFSVSAQGKGNAAFTLTCGAKYKAPASPTRVYTSETRSQLNCKYPVLPDNHRVSIFGVTSSEGESILHRAWYCERVQSDTAFLDPLQEHNILEAKTIDLEIQQKFCTGVDYAKPTSFSVTLEVPESKQTATTTWSCFFRIFGTDYISDPIYFSFEDPNNFKPPSKFLTANPFQSWTDIVLIALAIAMGVTFTGLGACGILWYSSHQKRKLRRARRGSRRRSRAGGFYGSSRTGGSRASLAGGGGSRVSLAGGGRGSSTGLGNGVIVEFG